VGFALSVMMILGFYLSIGALLKGDWGVIVVYVGGSVLGKYLSFLINKKIYKNKI
jgi:di/tricarboxylate transporter